MSNSAGSQSVLQPGDPGGDPLSRRVSSASLSRVLRSRRERCVAAVVEMFGTQDVLPERSTSDLERPARSIPPERSTHTVGVVFERIILDT
jgi:hypothetical protein